MRSKKGQRPKGKRAILKMGGQPYYTMADRVTSHVGLGALAAAIAGSTASARYIVEVVSRDPVKVRALAHKLAAGATTGRSGPACPRRPVCQCREVVAELEDEGRMSAGTTRREKLIEAT
jgi:hypothetical protein